MGRKVKIKPEDVHRLRQINEEKKKSCTKRKNPSQHFWAPKTKTLGGGKRVNGAVCKICGLFRRFE